MSRTYADYSPQEREMFSQLNASYHKNRADDLEFQCQIKSELLAFMLMASQKQWKQKTIENKYNKLIKDKNKELQEFGIMIDYLGNVFYIPELKS